MATTYTKHLQLPKHDLTDPFDITLINEAFDKIDIAFGLLIGQIGTSEGLVTIDGLSFITADGLCFVPADVTV